MARFSGPALESAVVAQRGVTSLSPSAERRRDVDANLRVASSNDEVSGEVRKVTDVGPSFDPLGTVSDPRSVPHRPGQDRKYADAARDFSGLPGADRVRRGRTARACVGALGHALGGVTNVRNFSLPHSRRWLTVGSRCLFPIMSFSEYETGAGRKKVPAWFALDECRPLAAFGGI